MRISDWSSDVCSSDLQLRFSVARKVRRPSIDQLIPAFSLESPGDEDATIGNPDLDFETSIGLDLGYERRRSEEHTSELQSLMRISYAVFCLKKKNHITHTQLTTITVYYQSHTATTT